MKAISFYGICLTVLLLILSGVLIYKLFFQDRFYPSENVDSNILITTDTVYDTVYITINNYIPKVVYVDTSKSTEPLDTLKAVKEYLATKTINDTILNDQKARIIIRDKLYRNMIISREPDIQLYNRNVHTTVIKKQPKKISLYAGILLCGNENKFGMGISANLNIKDKSNIGLGMDMVNGEYFVCYTRKVF